MGYDNTIEDLYADLNLHIRELDNFVNVFKIAMKCEYDQPESEQILDTLEIISQKMETIRNIANSINFYNK